MKKSFIRTLPCDYLYTTPTIILYKDGYDSYIQCNQNNKKYCGALECKYVARIGDLIIKGKPLEDLYCQIISTLILTNKITPFCANNGVKKRKFKIRYLIHTEQGYYESDSKLKSMLKEIEL